MDLNEAIKNTCEQINYCTDNKAKKQLRYHLRDLLRIQFHHFQPQPEENIKFTATICNEPAELNQHSKKEAVYADAGSSIVLPTHLDNVTSFFLTDGHNQYVAQWHGDWTLSPNINDAQPFTKPDVAKCMDELVKAIPIQLVPLIPSPSEIEPRLGWGFWNDVATVRLKVGDHYLRRTGSHLRICDEAHADTFDQGQYNNWIKRAVEKWPNVEVERHALWVEGEGNEKGGDTQP